MTNKRIVLCPVSIIHLALILFIAIPVSAQQLTVKEIMKEPSIAGQRAGGEQLSPDGKWVVYLWNAEGKNPDDLYLVPTEGGSPVKWLSPSDLKVKGEDKKPDPLEYGVVVDDEFVTTRRNGFGNLRWAPDSSKILFTRSGDIYTLKVGEKTPKRLTKTESSEFSADFLDNERILYQQSGNIFSINITDGTLTQISKEANTEKKISVFGATASKDGSMLAYIASDGSGQRALYVPNYLPYYTAAPSVRRGWTKFKIYVARTDGSLDDSIEIKLPEQEGEAYVSGMEWMADNKTLVIDRIDKTHKRRQVFIVPIGDKDPDPHRIFEETDDKWIGGPARILEPHPKNPDRLLLGSEKDTGFLHLHEFRIVRPKADEKWIINGSQVVRGAFEINWAKWFDDDTILFMSTADGTAERNFYQLRSGSSQFARVSDTFRGMRTSPQLEEGTLIFEGSDWKTPADLYVLPSLCIPCRDIKRPRNISNTAPKEFLERTWNEPKFTEFKARDGKMVPAKLYFPAGFDKAKKYPMVVFVHGAGYLQNVINGWNNYYREFMFNQLLTQKGFVVLDIDYRGSAGYGRDWRTDVYDFLGGKDYEDHVDGIDFMVREYNVDVTRVGTYGGSYGGFMAAMLAMRSPDRIKAAAALRPVMDWKNYYAANPFYTSQRLGDPKKNPEAYKRSSPIAYAAQLERKLLILHGVLDDNVHVQDSIQLVEQLMRLDKTEYFELMIYPAERHGFERPSSWEDEYERILALFEEELK